MVNALDFSRSTDIFLIQQFLGQRPFQLTFQIEDRIYVFSFLDNRNSSTRNGNPPLIRIVLCKKVLILLLKVRKTHGEQSTICGLKTSFSTCFSMNSAIRSFKVTVLSDLLGPQNVHKVSMTNSLSSNGFSSYCKGLRLPRSRSESC